jgi:hypothetical protein
VSLRTRFAAVSIGLNAHSVLTTAGAPPNEALELIVVLHIAMAHPSPVAAWLAGDPIFAAARREKLERASDADHL